MPRISACAKGLRIKATSCSPARRMSATNWPRPRISRSSSFRGSRTPTPCPAPAPLAEGNSRSLRTVAFSPIELTLTSLRRNGLRQNWRYCVVSRTGAQTERGLQQTLGENFMVLVVAKDKSSGTFSDHRDVGVHAHFERADFAATAEHLGRVGCDHRHDLFKREAERHHRAHRLDETELGLAGEGMIFVVLVLVRGAGGRRHVGVVTVNVRAERGGNDTGSNRFFGETIGEVAAVTDIDLQAAIERRLNHRMHFTLAVNEAAGMTRERMRQHIAFSQQRNHAR